MLIRYWIAHELFYGLWPDKSKKSARRSNYAALIRPTSYLKKLLPQTNLTGSSLNSHRLARLIRQDRIRTCVVYMPRRAKPMDGLSNGGE